MRGWKLEQEIEQGMEQELVVYKKQLTNIQKLVLYFFVYSFLGWLLETIYALFVLGTFVKRGFLYGPLCPIYGFGAILLIVILNKTKGKKTLEFFVSMIVFSAFEYIVSFIFEKVFGLRWWDYSNDFLNINGRISIAYSVAWGVIGLLFNEKLHPFVVKKIDKVKSKVSYEIQRMVIFVFPIITLVDFILSSIMYLKI